MPSLIRFFFGSAALPLGTASAADEATRAVEVRKVRRLSCINPLPLRDASHVSGNGLPAAIAFDERIRESVLAAGVFAFVAALSNCLSSAAIARARVRQTATTDSVSRTIRFIDGFCVQVIEVIEKSPASMPGLFSSQRKSATV